MKPNNKLKNLSIEIICLLYVVLFVYAASSKLLDFKNFQIQLGQSPMLSAYAAWIAVLIPFLEFFISLLLLLPQSKLIGLYASFSLMVLFSTYIVVILNYSSYVPCSCGGVLENLNWTQHLIFNLVFVFLALTAIYHLTFLGPKERVPGPKRFWISISVLAFVSSMVVVLLFISSEAMIHHRNPFVRRFIPHLVSKKQQFDLEYNSYYFAGAGQGKIYLGNSTNPSIVTVLDTALQQKKAYKIKLDNPNIPFRSIQLKVVPPHFYVLDGTVPCIFKGKTNNWEANLYHKGNIHFSAVSVVNDSTIAFRTRDRPNKENTLGTTVLGKKGSIQLHNNLLEKQIDGVFDTDGSLLYNRKLQKLIYVYYYRNQFIVTDSKFKLEYRGHTIDTNTLAKLKIAQLPEQGVTLFAAPPFTVNASAYAYHHLLFVHSTLEGKFESPKMWEQASVIDVYDIRENSYQFSFYVYHHKHKKMKRFLISDSCLFALIDDQIVSYSLAKVFKKKQRK